MVYKISAVDMSWKKVQDITLSKEIFDDSLINEWLIHEYIVMYLANKRQSSAHTKTRGEVKRSWRKLYNQKWWGRARVGDAWSPIRRSGGVAMGPRKERNWSKTMPQKMKQKALCGALTLKAKSKWIHLLKAYTGKTIKTQEAFGVLKNIWLDQTKTLLVLPKHDEAIEKSFRNIMNIKYTTASLLNVYDIMSYKKVLFLESALEVLKKRLLNK